MLNEQITNAVKVQKDYFLKGETLSYEFRINQLKKLRTILKKHEGEILDALKMDLGKHEYEAYITELSAVLESIDYSVKHLKKWMKPKRVNTPVTCFGATSKIYKQPLGVVLIMSPWNYPFYLSLAPMVAAIAAGNCMVVKPSSYSKNVSALVEKIVKEAFEEKYITVFQGNREINQMLLEEKFHHIFFTGSVKVGKIVMEAASKHLTPVTLELGGKSPCIVNKDADIAKSASRIVWGKTVNSGQTCVAPDYVLVHKDVKDELVAEMIKAKKRYFGEDMISSEYFGKIIRPQAFDGLTPLLDNQTVLEGGGYDKEKQKIELTLLDNPALDSPVMQREIFGPIMPIIPVDDMNEAIEIIRKYARPLALYVFTRDKAFQKKIVEEVHYGGGCINDVIMHLGNENLPFGGVGESGMGRYHADRGFDTFSHTKSVLKQNFLFDVKIRYAPYDGKLDMIKKILK